MGTPSNGDCFEPRSIDQVAGRRGTFGGVGSPDSDEVFTVAAHCDNADFLAGAGYPRTRDQATETLVACVQHLRGRFSQGVDGAEELLDGNGQILAGEVNLSRDCTFFGGVRGRAKCDAIEGLGRALHGVQDFYAHSNWTDEADRNRPIGPSNPPGLNRRDPSPILNLRDRVTPQIPDGLTTGCFNLPDRDPGVRGCAGRVTHASLNKDAGLIDPVTGATREPTTVRGKVGTNFDKAVRVAIADTRRQWRDFRTELTGRYGERRATAMICALTHDDPRRTC